MAELIIAAGIGGLAGLVLGPPLALWIVRFEDAIDRHRAIGVSEGRVVVLVPPGRASRYRLAAVERVRSR